jgi:hypothetical protein
MQVQDRYFDAAIAVLDWDLPEAATATPSMPKPATWLAAKPKMIGVTAALTSLFTDSLRIDGLCHSDDQVRPPRQPTWQPISLLPQSPRFMFLQSANGQKA